MNYVNRLFQYTKISKQSGNNIFLKLFSALFSIIFIFFIIYSFNIQVISSSKFVLKSSLLNVQEVYIQPLRGVFYDANDELLTKNVQRYDLYLRKKEYTEDKIRSAVSIIVQTLGRDEAELTSKFNTIKEEKFDLKVLNNLNSEEAYNLQNALKDIDYLYFKSGYKREYIYPQQFSHIIGYTSGVAAEDLSKGYEANDQIGRYKLEFQLEDQLKGVKGKSIFVGGVETREESQPGNNVFLTIDSNWQNSLYKILGNEIEYFGAAGGAGVIIDNSNGNVVAMVSYPGFDSNLFINGISNSKYQSYLKDRRNPLLDKAIGLQAAPGSTFKLITAYALLENGVVDENTTYYSNRCLNQKNFNFCEYHNLFYGNMDVVRAIYKSSNLFFCNNMLRMEDQGKLNQFVEAGKLFSIGEKTGINLVGEVAGNMDSPEYRQQVFKAKWFSGDTCNAAIGQGSIVTTPIQMAMVASVYENKGLYYQPNIISKITDQFGNIIEKPAPIVKKNIPISQKTLDLVGEGMSKVANYYDGTVYFYLKNVPGNIRAKTGTAEAYEKVGSQEVYRTHGWIVGNFDYKGKSYAFSMHMNYGGGGFYIARSLRKFVNCVYMNFASRCEDK